MDQLLLTTVMNELARALPGSRVDRVMHDERSDIYLAVRSGRQRFLLLLSPDRALPRIHLVTSKPAAVPVTGGIALALKSQLEGSRVIAAGLVNDDRIAQIAFSRAGKSRKLIFELFGHFPNILLLDDKDMILAVHHPVPPGEGIARPLMTGALYSPPAGRAPDRRPAGPALVRSADVGSAGEFASTNKHAEAWYQDRIEEQRLSEVSRRLSQALRRGLLRAERRVRAIESDLVQADKADEFQRAGNALLANLPAVRKGTASVELLLHDDTHINVLLDPSITPLQNAERYFKRYKKARSGRDLIMSRLLRARSDVLLLQQGLADLSAASDVNELLMIEKKVGKLIQEKSGIRHSYKAVNNTAISKIRRYMHNEWEILVGRSATGNEELTFRIAGEDDLWLHAEGLPGSHVVVRNPGRGEVPQDVVLRAASLAAYHSKGRSAGKVAVTYTRAKHVRKPRGAKRGTVILDHRRSVVVAPREGS